MAKIKVAAIQLKPRTDGTIMGILRDETVQRGLELLEKAVLLGANIACFPAFLPNVGKPEEITPPFVEEGNNILRAEAKKHGIFLITGCVTRPEKRYAVDELLINPEGNVVGIQRRIHLRSDDEWLLVPGDKFEIFQTSIGKIGIAEDLHFPEVARILAIAGADIIFAPSNVFVDELKTWHNFAAARAAENVIPLVAVNPALWRTPEDLTSGQKDAPQGGGSIIIDVEATYSPPEKVPLPQIKILSQAGMDEEVLVSEIDLEKTKEARTYWLSRRKPMLYSALCSQTTFDA